MTEEKLSNIFPTEKEITLDGSVYKIKAVSLSEIASFQKYCDSQKKKDLIELYNLADKQIDIKEIMEISGDETYYTEQMNTLDGVLFLLHRNITKHNTVDITLEQLSDKVNLKDMEEIINVLLGDYIKKGKEIGTEKNLIAKDPKKN